MPDLPPALPAGLPDEEWILQRLGASDSQLTAGLRGTYATIAPLALSVITTATELAIPSKDFLVERVVISGKVDFMLQKNHPVTRLLAATFPAFTTGQPLRIASNNGLNEMDVFNGKADLAIGEDGETITLAPWLRCHQNQSLFVDYHAGFDALPADLLEVFTQLCFLIAKETTRSGMQKERVQFVETTFTRKLPDWARLSMDGYRRVQVYV